MNEPLANGVELVEEQVEQFIINALAADLSLAIHAHPDSGKICLASSGKDTGGHIQMQSSSLKVEHLCATMMGLFAPHLPNKRTYTTVLTAAIGAMKDGLHFNIHLTRTAIMLVGDQATED